ncbi:acetamidase/formamidase family protein [Listeria sp. FSL L7-1485]|uniref:Acetamidase/formamidase family protein n=1 Tax=Listeria immobilis TaxID=2713502 RepID=A0A7X1C9R4_9LIST|nr:acetamidase/formamidase family protein [Listeria immobilis]MBC1483769.1 acetamidase/formamidase family protein [Listeria immobilis]MBC1489543.1 acetamidase/formamidase family protein [Listeria immobilis]MBC1507962.1 acetamidase/formamidase family protein [Listeria immobilis]MBC1510948.1 acetamidase/formamidase family protein [Listeria immobilis]MBC1516574.1 acetamidase/formamidase family protein [Listeria immobilis]
MKKLVTREQSTYEMDKLTQPALTVKDGSVVKLKIKDHFNSQIHEERLHYGEIDWKQFSPTSGPIFVDQAVPGDLLAVTIEKIKLTSNDTVLLNGPNIGILDDLLPNNSIRRYKIQNNKIIYSEQININVKKTIGLLKTESRNESKPFHLPTNYGGTLDSSHLTEGATVFLPVEKNGGLLHVGDVHATTGLGEITSSYAEIPAEVTLRLQILKNKKAPTPVIIQDNYLICIASKPTIESAAKTALQNMVNLLTDNNQMTIEDAVFLLSLDGDFQICQLFQPSQTASIKLALEYFPEMPFL